MKERFTTITKKGQMTLPAEFRRALGLKEGDKVAVRLESNQVQVTRSDGVVARTAGMFYTGEPPLTAEELREAAAQAIADSVTERIEKR